MWSDDHRYHTRRLHELQDDVERLHERARTLGGELGDDDFDGSEDSRARLSEARKALAQAGGLLESAREQLPVPRIRPPVSRLP